MKFHIHTFGCQMNERDSERMAAWLSRAGHAPAPDESGADLIIINTCSIRKKAEDKVYSLIGRLEKDKRDRPDLILAVAGCVAEQQGEALLRRFPGLNLVFGTHQIGRVAALVKQAQAGERVTAIGALPDADRLFGYLPFQRTPGVSTFVTIMEGCDNWCSYCVVPALRGRELSRPREEIMNEVRALTSTGYREFTLIGQNVNSYRPAASELDFTDLLALVAEIPDVLRLRFATSHPKDLSPRLIGAFAQIPNLAHHLHLPAQSGSNRVLAAMNRHYTREEYLEKVKMLRAACPDIAITTDMIIGFPGEEESDFRQTMDLLEQVRFDGSFSFVFSPRPGTRAADMAGTVENAEGKRRLKIFQDRQDEITEKINQALVGQVQKVLIEGINPKPRTRGAASLTGRTSGNKIVHLPGSLDLIGKITPVRITEAAIHSLRGTIEDNPVSSEARS